jgi:hypothetical protein
LRNFDGFTEVIGYIKNLKAAERTVEAESEHQESEAADSYTSVDFEDLQSVEVDERPRKN